MKAPEKCSMCLVNLFPYCLIQYVMSALVTWRQLQPHMKVIIKTHGIVRSCFLMMTQAR